MKKSGKKNSRILIILLTIIMGVGFIAGSVLMIAGYSQDVQNQAGDISIFYSKEISANLKASIVTYKEHVQQIAVQLFEPVPETNGDFLERLKQLKTDERFSELMFARYFKDGTEYDFNGEVYNKLYEAPSIVTLAENGELACAGVVYDKYYNNTSAVAFTVPFIDNPYADSMVLFVPVMTIFSFLDQNDPEEFSNSRLSIISAADGETLSILNNDGQDILIHNNIYSFLRDLTNDKNSVDLIRQCVLNGSSNAYPVQIINENHIISVSSLTEGVADPFAVISLYRTSDLRDGGYALITSILGTIILFLTLIVIVVVFFVIRHSDSERKSRTEKEINKTLDVMTRVKFEHDANDIISQNKGTSFAVIVIEVNHFDYIAERISSDDSMRLLVYLKIVFSHVLQLNEILGYLGDSQFVLLLHYREIETVMQKVKSVCSVASTYNGKLPSGFKMNLYGGIYKTELNITNDVSKMIDFALEAKDVINMPVDFGNFRFYNDKMHESNEQTEYIETHMEHALENKEFWIFFQPTQNLKKKTIEGCEALVRWYNKEKDEYMRPNVFMPLFEANRFIIKLDKYVYEQVCKYVRDSVANRQAVYPVSVNVSSITAMESDFVSYYSDLKRKYGISNGFITLEFPESLANEENRMLLDIMNALHKNGFRCTVDDFGSGYSPYNILKELPMDEIKLSGLFLKKGLASDRDVKILSGVINMAKDLNMKISQKNVETEEEAAMLEKLGCNAIQGYYYSKPLRMSDYIDFIDRSRHTIEMYT